MTSIKLFGVLWIYLEAGMLISLAYGVFAGSLRLASAFEIKLDHTQWVKMGYLLAALSLALPAVFLAAPKSALLRPAAQVWSGNRKTSAAKYAFVAPVSSEDDQLESGKTLSGFRLGDNALLEILSVFACGISGWFFILIVRIRGLHSSLRGLPVIRRIGRVQILVSDDHPIPFSTWRPGAALVVVPTRLLGTPRELVIAIRHELQHHRSGDTRWLYLMEFLKAFYFWNPCVYAFSGVLGQIQEFACDEVLIGRRKVSPQAYGSCLLQAAESAVALRSVRVGTAGMARSGDRLLLKRRIEMILSEKYGRSVKRLTTVFALGTLALLGTAAYATRSLVQERGLTLAEAQTYAKAATRAGEIPITVNDLVLGRLNRYIGTPEGRKYVSQAMRRMPLYRKMIEQKIKDYDLPEDLLAIAMFESGFDNEGYSSQHAAGIWQFIPSTAKRYDLVVTQDRDDRFDVEKETVAAMRYFQDLNGIFGDWLLAIKSYNEGESHVQDLIDQYGTRDAWTLERLSTRESYLSGAIAMMIILRNPELLK